MQKSLRSVAAIAAVLLGAHAVDASVVVDPFPGFTIFGGITVLKDLDGDGIDDIAFNTSDGLLEGEFNPVANAYSSFITEGGGLVALAPGALIGAGADFATVGSYAALPRDVENLIGFSFFIEGQRHYGWIALEIESFGITPVTIAWESRPGAGLRAGLIPEPSTLAIASALFAAAAVAVHRRRRN